MKSFIGTMIAAVVVLPGLSSTPAAGQSVFHAYLESGQVASTAEVASWPPPLLLAPPISYAGFGTFYLDPYTSVLTYRVTSLAAIPGIASVDIHVGAIGQEGPAIGSLQPDSSGGFAGSIPLNPGQRALLLRNRLYVCVKTTSAPSGAVRGQISIGQTQFAAFLDGAGVVPPVPTAAYGSMNFYLTDSTDVAGYFIYASFGLDPIKKIHVHRAPDGANGPAVTDLNIVCPFGCYTKPMTSMELAHIRAEDCYVDYHTTSYPGGELRGRLIALWTKYGAGCPGSLPTTPIINPYAGGFSINNVMPHAVGLLVVGLVGAQAPLGQGDCNLAVLPSAPHMFLPVVADSHGVVFPPAAAPPVLADTWVYLQYLGADAAAPLGLHATSGLGVRLIP